MRHDSELSHPGLGVPSDYASILSWKLIQATTVPASKALGGVDLLSDAPPPRTCNLDDD